jgi:diaminopimelate epimerase
MEYFLAEACENTFVVFDCLGTPVVESPFLQKAHDCLVQEKRDDALILIDGQAHTDALYLQMMVLGLDGSLGEFCGNGARAIAAYLFENYPMYKQFFLKTPVGVLALNKHGLEIYSVQLPPARLQWNPKFICKGFNELKHFTFVDMIEPHLVFEGELSDEELISLGRKLNAQKEIFPLGINLNAWRVLTDGSLYVRTYERGVQRLTQACGSGSVSCAVVYKQTGSIQVTTAGGLLEIAIQKDGIILKGPASFCDRKRRVAEA